MEQSKARSLTITTGLLLGLGEAEQTFVIEEPAAAAVFALLFLGAAWLVWRNRYPGVYIIGILALIEVMFAAFWVSAPTGDGPVVLAFAIVSAVALISATKVHIQRRRGDKPA